MTKQNTWLSGLELAEQLAIRPSRAAQILRCGFLDFELSAGGPLIHQAQIAGFVRNFPELLSFFRCELEVDKNVDRGEIIFDEVQFPTAKVTQLLKCVERKEPTFPDRRNPAH